ncbi:MAG: hypothetical protein RXP86_12085 [Acidilobus sp.]
MGKVELPEDLSKLLDMIKSYVKERGGLPSPNIDREIWEEVDALIKAIKSMNLPYSLKDIADELGVNYSSFMKNYKAFQRKMANDSGQEGEQPKVEVSRPKMGEEGSEGSKEGASNVGAGEAATAVPQERQVLEISTRAKVLDMIKKKYASKAEPLSEQHVEMIVGLGVRFYENYGNQCIQNGYEKLEDCMDDAMDALFNKMPEYEYLKEQFDKVVDAGAKLMLKLAEYAKKVQDLELIEKILTGEIDEELENITVEESQQDSGS